MPNYRRPTSLGQPIFFTVSLQDRGGDLLLREIDLLRHCVAVEQKTRPFGIDAWVVLPDHMHCIWQLPAGDAGYSIRWSSIKSAFSRHLPAARKTARQAARREKGIWQRRFWEHHLRDERDWQAHMEYCWFNPVKHGLVDRPADWGPSSIHRDIKLGRVSSEWIGRDVDGRFGEAA